MPPEIYNANPTVFATAKSSSLASNSLWMDDFGSSSDSDESDIEAIDPEEIFGMYPPPKKPMHICYQLNGASVFTYLTYHSNIY